MDTCTEEGRFAELTEHDAFISVAEFLSVQEVSCTRRVSKAWYENGKKAIRLYHIGLNNDGWSKWDDDSNTTLGWGMLITVDLRGNVRGANRNNAAHSTSSQLKKYSGSRINNVFTVNVTFPETNQINTYTGTITDNKWKGTFVLVRSCGGRITGTGGVTEGNVLEC